MTLSRRKKLVFALVGDGACRSSSAMLLLLIADLFVHYRAERSAGLNRWGYRGPVASSKKQRRAARRHAGRQHGVRLRRAVGSIDSGAAREQLNASRPFSVVNLGFNNEGAYSFVPTLRDFEYLDYDIVVLYEGYNDMPGDEGPNTSVFRHNSAVYRLTGYFPILPLYLDEKAMMLRYGGDLGAAYAASRGEAPKTVFRPNIAAAYVGGGARHRRLGDELAWRAARPIVEGRSSGIRTRQPYWLQLPVGELLRLGPCRGALRCCRKGKRVIVVGQPRMSAGMVADRTRSSSTCWAR